MEINQAVLTAVIGLFAGALGSIVAPWVKWGIEKRKLKLEKRKQILEEFRTLLLSEGFERKKIVNHPNYYVIRDFLSEESIEELETKEDIIYGIVGSDPFDHSTDKIFKSLSELEKKWGIR